MDGYMVYIPTRAERFWRWAGFHSHIPEMSEEGEKLPGWIMTKVGIHLGFFDRLRLLIKGELLVRIEIRTSASPEHLERVISASSVELVAPGKVIKDLV